MCFVMKYRCQLIDIELVSVILKNNFIIVCDHQDLIGFISGSPRYIDLLAWITQGIHIFLFNNYISETSLM